MRRRSIVPYAAVAALAALAMSIDALQDEANYDEAKVPAYTLPDPLRAADGSAVDAATWRASRRAEVLELFRRHVYGRAPGRPEGMSFTVRSRDDGALGGTAVRKQVTVRFGDAEDGPALDLLLYLPSGAEGPVPVFCGLNFCGNHAVQADPGVDLPGGWMMRDDAQRGYVEHRATEASRGAYASRWPVPELLARGYGLATAYYGDLDPDFDDGFQNGVHALDPPPAGERAADAWGAIGAWAWGLSRMLDYLERDPDVDGGRVAVVGHSRLGKTALWAGARDERFALVISNDSGCGGAALSRRRYGETVERITRVFPHWFCADFRRFAEREDELPVDQHMLIALAAPRPVLVCSASEDRWADPRGEFLSALHAGPVFERLGGRGLPSADFPAPGELLLGDVGYFLRAGGHDMTLADWEAYMDFADHHYGHGER